MKSNENTLKEVIDALFKVYGLDVKLAESKIKNNWAEIVGPLIAKHTNNLYISKRKLYIKVDNSVVRSELMFMRTQLTEKINTYVNQTLIDEVLVY
jgi:predicted nucleic acid-binding Zn ribbon protein